MQYNKSITIEANSKNRKGGTNNSFEVTFPNVIVPKGANINISGCIIEEKGASNGSILELSDKNISKTNKYNSCTQRLKFNYYLTNNGYQTVAAPFIFKNGYTSYDGTVHNDDLDAITHNAYLSIQQAYNADSESPSVYSDVDYAGMDDRDFVELKIYTRYFSDKTQQPEAPDDPDHGTGDLIDSPASVYCSHKTVQPDGVKYILIDPIYNGPSIPETLQPMTGQVDIDLKDSLLQTPEEISYRINTVLQASEPNVTDNLVDVKGLPAHFGTTTIDADFKQIFNFTSNTIKNIPANLQMPTTDDGTYLHPIYSNMAVRNLDKWSGGVDFLNTCGFTPGVDFTNWNLTDDELEDLFRNISGGSLAHLRHYPVIMGASYNLDKPILTFGLMDWEFQAPTGHFHYQFSNNNNGNPIQAPFHYIAINEQPGGTILHWFAKQVIDPFDINKIALELYEPDNPTAVGQTLTYSNGPLGATLTNIDINSRTNIVIKSYVDLNGEPDLYYLVGNQNVKPDYFSGIVYNGLPYITCHDSDSGGRIGRYVNDTTDYNNHINEFLSIPQYYAIPTNITISEAHAVLIQSFFRKNEIYLGVETDYKKQQADNENWVIEWDLGFNDSYLSTKNIYPKATPTAGAFLKGTCDSSANFSFFGPYFPNMISAFNNKNRHVTLPSASLNRNFPLQVYPMNSQSDMGSDITSQKHKIYLYSRFHETTMNNIIKHTSGQNYVNQNDVSDSGDSLEMTTNYISAGYDIEKDNVILGLAKKYNIMVVAANYTGCDRGFCFVNAFPTLDGTGRGAVDYRLGGRSENFRTAFRVCTGTYCGFDPSPLINNFILPMNRQQTNTQDNSKLVRQWDISDYYPDDDDHAKYSSFIEDYINNVWVGAVNPQINFSVDRFEIVNFHTPRLFNQEESKSTGIAVGSEVAIFNEQDQPFRILRIFDSTEEVNLIKTKNINFGIADAITGLFIVGLEVQDENGNFKECTFDDDFNKTINYEGCLFSRLGFKLSQFLFPYGSQDKRFNLFNQNNLTDKKYEYNKYFTTEGFLNQGIEQLLSIYGANQPDNTAAGGVNIRGLPQYYNGYVGLQQFTIACNSFKVRALNLPARLINSYYHISTSLPSTAFISNNNFVNVNAYVYKQYRTGNFFFSYASDQIYTSTEEFVLSNLRINIKNNNGVLASNLGENNTIFLKITYPQSINQPSRINTSPEVQALTKINENIKDLEKLRINPKSKVVIGQNAALAEANTEQQAMLLASAYDPPIPEPPYVMGAVIPDMEPRFPVVNPSTLVSSVSGVAAEPERKEETVEAETKLSEGPIQTERAPFPLEDPILYAARRGNYQSEAELLELDEEKNIIYNNIDIMLKTLETPPEDPSSYTDIETAAAEANIPEVNELLDPEIVEKQQRKKEAEVLLERAETRLEKMRDEAQDTQYYRDFLREKGEKIRGRRPKYSYENKLEIYSRLIEYLTEFVYSGSWGRSTINQTIPTILDAEQDLIEEGIIQPIPTPNVAAAAAAAAAPKVQQQEEAAAVAPQKEVAAGRPQYEEERGEKQPLIRPEDEALNKPPEKREEKPPRPPTEDPGRE